MSVDILDEMAKFVFATKYARFDDKLQRREVWGETVDRVEGMHLRKFDHLDQKYKDEIKWAFNQVRDKKVLPSMRSMQFGGKAIEDNNLKQFNCAVRHVDSIRSFAEITFSLLCGNGIGIGLSKKFLGRLPDLVNADDKNGTVITYVVQDDIQGWADSIEALLMCYFRNTAYSGRKIVFDYSKIRRKGSKLKTSGGKAPGYSPLKSAHTKIKALLDHIIEDLNVKRLGSIHAYDLLMHVADCVVSGGSRRSATAVIFEATDSDMLTAKTFFTVEKYKGFEKDSETELYEGKVFVNNKWHSVEKVYEYDYNQIINESKISWFYVEPQRARSNNSILLARGSFDLPQFQTIIDHTRQFGEPGFVFADKKAVQMGALFNPCQPEFAPILTKDGIRTFKDLQIGNEIWSERGWTKVVNKWSTGYKEVFAYKTKAGVLYSTENHKVVSNGEKIEAMNADTIDILQGNPLLDRTDRQNVCQAIVDGLVLGDGTAHKASKQKVYLIVGEKDQDYFTDPISLYFIEPHSADLKRGWKVDTTITDDELPQTFLRTVPDRFIYAEPEVVAGFLRGLFSANGSVCGNRVTLKSSSRKLVEQAQLMLSSIGIRSYFTTNKPTTVTFVNGDYNVKESYDLNITRDRVLFSRIVGFIQKYKNDKLAQVISNINREGTTKESFDIYEVESAGIQEVFDITVDNDTHTYWTGGLNVSNCFEVNFIPVTEDGICGLQVCNLTSVNGEKVHTEEDFSSAVKAATIIGTLQATYTDFPYLSPAAKKLTEEEALLGVSITAMMANPDILLNPEVQKRNSELAVALNKEWAKVLGINQAARVTLIKPEGTGTLALGSVSSGIHPAHSHKFFRRIQMNTQDNVYQWFKGYNENHCENSIWNSNGTDDVVTFPIEIPKDHLVKSQLSAIQHLEFVRSTQINWVNPGTTKANKKPINHNVSCTIIVKDNEWEEVIQYLFDNQDHFSAVSLISDSGDKSYKQAPYEAVATKEDKELFDKLVKSFRKVDYERMREGDDTTELQKEMSCFGGACTI
jgi:hypothetical protein